MAERARGRRSRRAAAAAGGATLIATALAVALVPAASAPDAGSKVRLSFGPEEGALTVVAAEGATVYAAWKDASRYAGLFPNVQIFDVVFRRSDDGGYTFGPQTYLGSGIQPSIAAAGDDVHVAWQSFPPLDGPAHGNAEIWVASSSSRGARFDEPVRLDNDDAFSLPPHVVATDAGAWVSWSDRHGDVYVSGRRSALEPWSLTKVASGGDSDPSAIGAAGGNVVVAWKRRTTTDKYSPSDVTVAASSDAGVTFGPPVDLGRSGSTVPASPTDHVIFGYMQVAVQDADAFVTWYEEPAVGSGRALEMVAASQDGGATFGPAQTLGPIGYYGSVPSIVARRGLVAVAWGGPGGVMVASSADRGATFSTLPVAPGDNATLPVIATARDQDGPRAAFGWSVPARFGLDADGDGLIDYRTDAASARKPATLPTTLDGCGSAPDGSAPMVFDWTVDGAAIAGHECRVVHDLSPGPVHRVTLEVTQGRHSNLVAHDVTVDDRLVVSIGDSVGSGEGNPDVPGASTFPWSADARWQDLQCNRSAKAGPALAARALEDADPHTSVTFLHLACSGASILGPDVAHGGLLTPYEGINPRAGALLPPQLDQLRTLAGDRPVDVLMVSIGANDVHFSEIVQSCISAHGCAIGPTPAAFNARLTQLPDHFRQLSEALEGLVPPDHVYISQYFDPTTTETGAWDLGCVLAPRGIADSDARWASQYVVANLNGAVAAAAGAYGWNLVGGIAAGFRFHGYCAADSWVVQLGQAFEMQDSQNGGFHPNNAGHQLYGDALAAPVAARWQESAPETTPATGLPRDALGDVYVAWRDGPEMMVATLVQQGGDLQRTGPPRNLTHVTGEGYGIIPSLAATAHGAFAGWTEHLDQLLTLESFQAFGSVAATGPPNFAVASAGLIQSAEGAPVLIAGKSTAVEAVVDSTFPDDQWALAHYRVSDAAGTTVLDASAVVSLHPGQNRIFLQPQAAPFLPADGATLKATVEIDPNEQIVEGIEVDNVAESPAVPVARTRKLKLLYVPVAGASCANASAMAGASASFVEGVLPLADGALAPASDCAFALAAPAGASGPAAAVAMLGQLDTLAHLLGYDQAVGVAPAGWLFTGWAPKTIGLAPQPPALAAPAAGVLVDAAAPPEVVVHELGHAFGQAHVAGAAALGYWPAQREQRRGNDLMNPTVVFDPWLSRPVFERLRQRLVATPADPPVLMIRGAIAADGTVSAGPWFRQDGLLDAALSAAGPTTLEYRDGAGATLGSVGFDAAGAATLRSGPGLPQAASPGAGVRLFSLRVPDLLPGTRLLALREGTKLLFTRAVSEHAPTVAFIAPAGGGLVPSGSSITATVAAADADGDALAHTFAVSADAGATWRPLAMDVAGSTITFRATADLAGTDVRLRVFTSDGVNTAIADSPSFAIEAGAPAPDQLIAWVREEDGVPVHRGHLWTMHTDGSQQREVALPPGDYDQPAFSPDGSRLVFTAAPWPPPVASLRPRSIAVAGVDGSGFVQLTSEAKPPSGHMQSYLCPDWSPDGSRLSFVVLDADVGNGTVSNPRIMTMAPDGTDRKLVVSYADSQLDHFWVAADPDRSFYQMCPRWSPSGTALAFIGRKRGQGYVVHTVGADGTALRRVREAGGVRPTVDWSPDGGRLLFAELGGGQSWELWTMDPDGGNVYTLGRLPFESSDIRFIPDGTRLYGSYDLLVGNRIATFALDSSDLGQSYIGAATDTRNVRDYVEPDWVAPPAAPPTPPVPPPPPAASAGGPYQAIAGSPVQLSAGASALAAGETPRAAWDLDGDGQFDDATGLYPVVTFPAAGTAAVAVRLTTFGGATATSAPATVTIAEKPPVLLPAPRVAVAAGTASSLLLAMIADPGAAAYIAAADWGDGTVEPCTVTAGRVAGTHTFATTGERVVTVGVCVAPATSTAEAGPCAQVAAGVTVVASVTANQAPAAADVAVTTPVATRVSVPLAGSDGDGNPIAFHLTADGPGLARHGQAAQLPDGVVTYTPEPSFAGVDRFTYVADDGRATSAPATVTVTVGNAPPVAGDDQVHVPRDVAVEIPARDLLANDADPEGAALALAGAYTDEGSRVTVERTVAGVRVTPAAGFTGTTTFRYGVTDGGGGFSLGTVSVIVDGPVDGGSGGRPDAAAAGGATGAVDGGGAGGAGGARGTGGSPAVDAGPRDAGPPDAIPAKRSGGCSCEMSAGSPRGAGSALLALVLLAALARRARKA